MAENFVFFIVYLTGSSSETLPAVLFPAVSAAPDAANTCNAACIAYASDLAYAFFI